MAEDAIGFRFFSLNQQTFIANDNAVRNASHNLQNQVAHDAAFQHLGRAVEAVSAAARKKAARNDDFPDDNPNDDLPAFTENVDFFDF